MCDRYGSVGDTHLSCFAVFASINRPGGCGRIVQVHVDPNGDVRLDVKYIIGVGSDLLLDPTHVTPYEELPTRCRSRREVPAAAVHVNSSKADKENEPKQEKRRSCKAPSKKKKKPEQSKQAEQAKKPEPKRAFNFQIPRPKKKVMKKSEKRESLDPTEALSDDAGNPQVTLPHGIPPEISVEPGQPSFFSPLNTHSKLDSIQNVQSPSSENLHEGGSLSSVSEEDTDYIEYTEKGVTTIIATSKSPVSCTKQLMSGDLQPEGTHVNTATKSSHFPQHPTKLERLQKTQLDVAKKFVNEVVQHTVESPVREPEPPEESERETHFRSCLQFVLQMNDGYVNEEDLIRFVNETSLERQKDFPLFEEEEVRVYIESLLSNDRIMLGDGMIIALF